MKRRSLLNQMVSLREAALRGDPGNFWRHADALKSALIAYVDEQKSVMMAVAQAKHGRQSS